MKYNKKGAGESPIINWVILIAIMVVAFIFIKMFIIDAAGSNFSSQIAKIKSESCITNGERAKATGTVPLDRDFGPTSGDGYPDACDICLGGNNKLDADLDGMPDACDNDPSKPPSKGMSSKAVCENGSGNERNEKTQRTERSAKWNPETGQCVLDCYKKGCTA